MSAGVKVGQSWSVWVPGRQQWLLASVVHQEAGQATLKYDVRYGLDPRQRERNADEAAMLENVNLFRLLCPKVDEGPLL
jgi:hypothetical protein